MSDQETKLFQQLSTLLTDLTAPAQTQAFLQKFLTEAEQSMFAKRLGIIWLLHQGKSYEEISDQLKVSSATISSVAAYKDEPAIKHALKLLERDAWLEKLLP